MDDVVDDAGDRVEGATGRSPADGASAPRAGTASAPAVHVVVVCDVRLFREGIAGALRDQAGIRRVEVAATHGDALALIREHAPDVVVIDMGMAARLDTVHAVAAGAPSARIVAFGVAGADDEVLACAERGVAGYVTREGTLDDLLVAIHGAVRGELHCSPGLASAMFRRLGALAAAPRAAGAAGGGTAAAGAAAARLTSREREVLAGLEQGLSNKAIAWRLGVEQATVKNHVHNVLQKLHIRRRSEAAARAHARREG